MEEIKFKYEGEQKTNDPLKMLAGSSSSGEPNGVASSSTSSTSGSGQEPTGKKDDVRINEAMSHVHNNNLITRKDLANLKRNRYDKVREQFKDSFVILNKKTGQMVEIRAASSVHACNIIGWRPNNCKLIDVIKGEDKTPEKENNTGMAGTDEKEVQVQKENTDASANGSNTAEP